MIRPQHDVGMFEPLEIPIHFLTIRSYHAK